MSDNTFLPTQTLALPAGLPEQDEVEIRESLWWHLNPGEIGYNQPIWAYCGMTEEAWRARRLERGYR